MEAKRGTNERYSWVEFVARKSQPPDVLVSHAWSGKFRDFMEAIESASHDNELSSTSTFWVCTFALNQFRQDLGTNLEDSPFYLAIQNAKRTVLVVDCDAASLTRSWCGLELHFTKKFDKILQIYTPAGRVGSSRVKSGPLVEVMEVWDVFSCEASEDADRRQILNYLSGGKVLESGDIQCREDGSWVVKDGWRKQLSDVRLMEGTTQELEEWRQRDGDVEYQYEVELLKQHEAAFEQLNQSVRASVVLLKRKLQKLSSDLPHAPTKRAKCLN